MDLSRHKVELALRSRADSEARVKRLSSQLAYRMDQGCPYAHREEDWREFRQNVDSLLAKLTAEVAFLYEATDRVNAFPSCEDCGESYDHESSARFCAWRGCPSPYLQPDAESV